MKGFRAAWSQSLRLGWLVGFAALALPLAAACGATDDANGDGSIAESRSGGDTAIGWVSPTPTATSRIALPTNPALVPTTSPDPCATMSRTDVGWEERCGGDAGTDGSGGADAGSDSTGTMSWGTTTGGSDGTGAGGADAGSDGVGGAGGSYEGCGSSLPSPSHGHGGQ
jgi:hypothetical protein